MQPTSFSIHPDTALLLDAVRQPLVVCDDELRVVFANRGFIDNLALGDVQAGDRWFELDEARWDVPGLRQLVEAGPSEPSAERQIELTHPTRQRQTVVVSARWVRPTERESDLIVFCISEFADRHTTEAQGATSSLVDSKSARSAFAESGAEPDMAEVERWVLERTRDLEAQRQAALALAEQAERARLESIEATAALQRADVQLRQSQKMEAVGKLAGGIAHDFNNLLTAILSFSEFVTKTMDPSDQAYHDMMEVTDAAQRAAELTSQLLAFSQQRTIEPKVVNLNQKVRALERMLERLLTEEIELVAHLDAVAGTIRVDVTALEQIVVNLAVNAKDAMPRGGRLVIETALVTLDDSYGAAKGAVIPPGEYVTLSLSDTGLGMDDKTQQHIFEPFFTTKEIGRGTGLGLSTVYGIVKQAGGFIWVYSELGKGTTFRVYFPKIDAPTTKVRSSVEQAVPTGSETVLVVEDDDRIRRLCVRALSPLGYRVIVAASGAEALELCEREAGAVDLLLTDVVMPRMSGKQLALRLGQMCPEVKVMFMSGYTPNVIVHHGVVDDGVVLLQKPFTIDGIGRKVREVLDSDAYFARELATRIFQVLLVEDDVGVQAQVKGLLDSRCELTLAQTGEEALARIKSAPPDVVICACRLNGILGSELYHSVRALNPHLVDRFLFIASHADGAKVDLLGGIDRPLLRKPLADDEFRDELEVALGLQKRS